MNMTSIILLKNHDKKSALSDQKTLKAFLLILLKKGAFLMLKMKLSLQLMGLKLMGMWKISVMQELFLSVC